MINNYQNNIKRIMVQLYLDLVYLMYNHYYIESCKGIITSFYYNINKLLVTESNCIIFGTVSECERVIRSDVLLLLPVPQRVGSHVGVKVW